MSCLLVSATAREIDPFLTHYRQSDMTDLDILVAGIGMTATTYALAKQIALKRPYIIIQAGIAGCFDENLSKGSVVVVKKDTIADLSVMENKQLKTMFDLGLVNLKEPPFKNGWLENPHRALIRQTKLKPVNAVSVNHISTSKKMIGSYRDKFEPVTESMEGAALHYVCLMENIPFLQLRSISNYIGERNKAKWDFRNSIINLNKELLRIVEGLSTGKSK